jgi:hypothetical protein
MKLPKMAGVLLLAGAIGASAHAMAPERAGGGEISCQATHEISCGGDGACASAAGDTIYVNFRYDPATRHGDLCTYTYCRGFELLPQPAAPGQTSPPDSGFTLSEHAGSTEEHQNRPVVDYQLSLNEDRTRFVLVNVVGGGAGGWAGRCAPSEP